MIPDRLQYFLEHFWTDQQCDHIWTLGPRIYHQNTLRIQENIGSSLNIFSYLGIWNYDCLEGMCTYLSEFPNVRFFKIYLRKLQSLRMLSFENFEILILGTLGFRIFNIRPPAQEEGKGPTKSWILSAFDIVTFFGTAGGLPFWTIQGSWRSTACITDVSHGLTWLRKVSVKLTSV